jgi:hypothetical protein
LYAKMRRDRRDRRELRTSGLEPVDEFDQIIRQAFAIVGLNVCRYLFRFRVRD